MQPIGTRTRLPTLPDDEDDVNEERSPRRSPPAAAGALTLNINIQLQLPANADGKTYEALFAAMGKHLKDLGGLG